MSERESRDTATTTRSTNVVHFTERSHDAAAALIAGLVDRSAGVATEGNIGFLAVTPTPDDALSLSESVVKLRHGATRPLMPVTSLTRGRRILSLGSGMLTASATDLARLIAESRLVLTELHTLVVLWPEELLEDETERAALESFIAEVPRSTERVAVCARRSAELAQFLERSMWRAREMDHTATVASANVPLRVFTATPAEQVRALRSVLDTFDPPSTVLLAFSNESEAAARRAAAIFDVDGALVQVHRGVSGAKAALGIVFDDVPNADELASAAENFAELVAIVRPGKLAGIQQVAPGSTPMAWTGALANARSIQDALRDEIRSFAGSGAHLPWVPIVEPLLEGLDAIEIAASALSLLDRERRKAKKAAALAVTPIAPPPVQRDREGSARPAPRGDRDRNRDRDRDRDRDDRRRPDDRKPGSRRGGDIERMPRAARESREWSERSERLRHSRRGPRRGEDG